MINRINLILKAKNITARQFAEEIGIQPSGMSHIMGGRNNPSLDFVTKVIRRYPEIDANWLLLGRGEMYTSGVPIPQTMESPAPQEATLFPELEEKPVVASVQSYDAPAEKYDAPAEKKESPAVEQPANKVSEPSDYVPAYIAIPPEKSVHDEPRSLTRLLFIYSDGTFETYLPSNKEK
jgi:transcriptional regulator with XRE-family HTH domain